MYTNVVCCAAAVLSAGADTLHIKTSPDSFMKEQYTTKAELMTGLRDHPAILKAMAECFGTNPDALYRYVEKNVSLGRLAKSGMYPVWGLRAHRKVYLLHRHFKKGEPVWMLADGTPILRWRCANPMATSLPAMTASETAPPPPPEPVVTPPPPKPPEPVAPPVEPPAPPVVAPPPPPVAPPAVVTPPPPPPPSPPTPPVAPPPPTPPVVGGPWLPITIKFSHIAWYNASHGETDYIGGGLAYDLGAVHWGGRRGVFGLYFDSLGQFQPHPVYKWLGGGVEYRQYLAKEGVRWNPYLGVGLGYYRVDLQDWAPAHSYDRLGGKAFLGLELSNRFFVELGYDQLGESISFVGHKRDLSRPEISVGLRF